MFHSSKLRKFGCLRLQNFNAHGNCVLILSHQSIESQSPTLEIQISDFCHLFVRSFVPSFVPSFLRSFLRSFVPPFVRSSVRSFLRSFLRSFVPPFVRSSVRSFLRSFVPPLVPPFVPPFLRSSLLRSSVPPFVPPFVLSPFAPPFVCFCVRVFVRSSVLVVAVIVSVVALFCILWGEMNDVRVQRCPRDGSLATWIAACATGRRGNCRTATSAIRKLQLTFLS